MLLIVTPILLLLLLLLALCAISLCSAHPYMI
jgi:hypothetical protein